MAIFSRIGRATRTGYDSMIKARQRQVDRYLVGALLSFDDTTLAQAGYDRKELETRASTFIAY